MCLLCYQTGKIAVLRVFVLMYNMRMCMYVCVVGKCYCKWLSKLFLLHYLIETTTTAAAAVAIGSAPPVQNRTTSGPAKMATLSMVVQIDRDRSGERGRFQLLVLLHFQHLLWGRARVITYTLMIFFVCFVAHIERPIALKAHTKPIEATHPPLEESSVIRKGMLDFLQLPALCQ